MRLLSGSLCIASFLGVVGCSRGERPSSVEDLRVDERIPLAGLSASVDVVRDDRSRPHVFARDDIDAARVTGFIHASDRFLQMDIQRRVAGGTLAELVGGLNPAAAAGDRQFRSLGLARVAEQELAAMSPDERAILVAYADGVNAWVASIDAAPAPEYEPFWFNMDPSEFPSWKPEDSILVSRLAAFSLSWRADWERLLDSNSRAVRERFPSGDPRSGMAEDTYFFFAPSAGTPIVGDPSMSSSWDRNPPTIVSRTRAPNGPAQIPDEFHGTDALEPYLPRLASNSWVVSGLRMESGNAVLCNDSHGILRAPTTFYELHLETRRAGGDLAVAGLSLPGTPFVLIGANENVAWGLTSQMSDVTDVYVERVVQGTDGSLAVEWDPDGPAGTEPAQWVPTERLDETIEVRNLDGTVTGVPFISYRLTHRTGTIVPDSVVAGTALSVSWTGLLPSTETTAVRALSRAVNVQDAADAVSQSWIAPPENFVFADADGNIGYVGAGHLPIRLDDDGDLHTDPPFLPLRGFDGAHEWSGSVPAEQLPRTINPPSGWVVAANQDPLGTSIDGDPLDDVLYLSEFFDPGFRAGRIEEVLESRPRHSVEDLMDLQGDHVSSLGRRFVPFLLESIGSSNPAVTSLLEEWAERGFHAEAGMDAAEGSAAARDSAATSLFNTWLVAALRRALADEIDAAGASMYSIVRVRTLLFLLEQPEDAQTYDAIRGESVLWDDLSTTGVWETRDEIFREALAEATTWLASGAGFGSPDPNDWRWGELHRLVIRRLSGLSTYDLPDPADEEFGDGFPRPGDQYSVDIGDRALSSFDATYRFSPEYRLIVEVREGKPRIYNVMPGGVSGDPESAHYDDQILRYTENRYFQFWFTERDIVRHATNRVVFEP